MHDERWQKKGHRGERAGEEREHNKPAKEKKNHIYIFFVI